MMLQPIRKLNGSKTVQLEVFSIENYYQTDDCIQLCLGFGGSKVQSADGHVHRRTYTYNGDACGHNSLARNIVVIVMFELFYSFSNR
jgi:hypothetical protein